MEWAEGGLWVFLHRELRAWGREPYFDHYIHRERDRDGFDRARQHHARDHVSSRRSDHGHMAPLRSGGYHSLHARLVVPHGAVLPLPNRVRPFDLRHRPVDLPGGCVHRPGGHGMVEGEEGSARGGADSGRAESHSGRGKEDSGCEPGLFALKAWFYLCMTYFCC